MATINRINKIKNSIIPIERAKEIIQNFDALLITAGPGMSESSGYSEIRSNKVKLIN